jgi:hypothetical protein
MKRPVLGDFYSDILQKIKFGSHTTKITHTLHKGPRTVTTFRHDNSS